MPNDTAYTLTDDPYFDHRDDHLLATFGDNYALRVESGNGGFRCHLRSDAYTPNDGWFTTFTTVDPRDVLALAVSTDNHLRTEEGELLDDAPFNGFVLLGQHIHNPFADPEYGDWRMDARRVLLHPRASYGQTYDDWAAALAEERVQQIADAGQGSFAGKVERGRVQAGRML